MNKVLLSGETIFSAEGATTPETLRQKDRSKHNTLERDLFPPKEQNSQAKIQMGVRIKVLCMKNILKLII